MNVRKTLAEREELPPALLVSVLSDSLLLMRVFYGSIQPSESRSLSFRLELLRLVETVAEASPGDIPDNDAHEAHYLVLLTAVAGATDYEITESVPEDANPPDFTDYLLTLPRVARVLEGDGLDVGEIAAFVK
jgi:hypothetical protein